MRRVKRPARTVIITGASAGVGRAIAHRFAREGGRVGLIARGQAALTVWTFRHGSAPHQGLVQRRIVRACAIDEGEVK